MSEMNDFQNNLNTQVDLLQKNENRYKTPTWKYIVALAIYIFPLALNFLLSVAAGDQVSEAESEVTPNLGAFSMFITYFIWFILLVALFYKELVIAFKHGMKNTKKVFLSAPILWIAGILILFIIENIFGIESTDAENQLGLEHILKNADIFYQILLIISVVLLGPIVEELIFRRTIFAWLAKYSIVLSYIVSSLAFGLLHVVSGGDYLFLILYAAMGVVFGGAYHFSKNIYTPIIVHIIHNTFSVIAIFNNLPI